MCGCKYNSKEKVVLLLGGVEPLRWQQADHEDFNNVLQLLHFDILNMILAGIVPTYLQDK